MIMACLLKLLIIILLMCFWTICGITGGYKKSMNFEEVLVTVGEFCKALGDENYLSIDPMFTDPENGDLTLKESGPAKDAGTMGLDLGISPV